MDKVPPDALAAVFGYLDARGALSCRGVCRHWSEVAGSGCLTLSVKYGAVDRDCNIGSVTFTGREQRSSDDENRTSEHRLAKTRRKAKRTCGRLPQPAVLSQEGDDGEQKQQSVTFASTLLRDFEFKPNRTEALTAGRILSLATKTCWGSLAAIRIENAGLAANLFALDLEASSFEQCSRCLAGRDGPIYDDIIQTKRPRLLRRCIESLDVSGLRHLKQLSVRACGDLRDLQLPKSLEALDASGCSDLLRTNFPAGADGTLRALNLNGCRSLKKHEYRIFQPCPGLLGPSTGDALRNVRDLDMSHVCRSAALDAIFCNALQKSSRLEMFSLRYGATDAVLLSLSESSSARRTLRLVDVAFSSELTDEAVDRLARSSPRLERLNMRGCKKVTPSCYNDVAIFLERRRNGDGCTDESLRSCRRGQKRRKGDNVFFFCQKG